MDKKETICAVVVTYNRKELLLECLESLLKQTYPLDAIYIIDNASTDSTPEILKEKGYIKEILIPTNEPIENENIIHMLSEGNQNKEVKVYCVRMHENTGGAGGFHEGVKRGYEREYNWLWLMDDDVCPDQKALEALMNYKKEYSILIPVKVAKDKQKIIDWSGLSYDLVNPFLKNPKLPIFKVYAKLSLLPDTLEVKDFSFEGPIFKREVIDQAGFPEKKLFIYFDDTEYALRIRNLGYKLLLIKDALIIKKIDNEKPLSTVPWKDYYYKRNLLWIRKKYGQNVLVKYLNPILFFLSALLIKGILKLNYKNIKIIYYAFIDSLDDKLVNRFKPYDAL